MGFVEAVKAGMSKYATFKGRARRSEYWWFYLFFVFSYMAGLGIDNLIGNEVPILAYAILAVLFLPQLAVTVRRLHDTGRSAWSLLISLIPLAGAIWLLVVTIRDSELRDNEYGLWPKYTPDQLGVTPSN